MNDEEIYQDRLKKWGDTHEVTKVWGIEVALSALPHGVSVCAGDGKNYYFQLTEKTNTEIEIEYLKKRGWETKEIFTPQEIKEACAKALTDNVKYRKRIKELEGVLRKAGEHHQGGHSKIGSLIRTTLLN